MVGGGRLLVKAGHLEFSSLQDGCLLEVGANSRLGASLTKTIW